MTKRRDDDVLNLPGIKTLFLLSTFSTLDPFLVQPSPSPVTNVARTTKYGPW
jgi:hypothetical protein